MASIEITEAERRDLIDCERGDVHLVAREAEFRERGFIDANGKLTAEGKKALDLVPPYWMGRW